MKRIFALVICLVLTALTLTACQQAEEEPQDIVYTVTQAVYPVDTPYAETYSQSTDSTEGVSIFDSNPYIDSTAQQALSEEDDTEEEYSVYDQYSYYDTEEDNSGYTFDYSAAATVYPYAGSTPIPLDPIDKPTATPRPELEFTYMQYSSPSLGITFEGPVNWITDESNYGLFLLKEPQSQMKDGFATELQISREAISEAYTQKMLATYVKQRLSTIAEARLSKYEASSTATRYMLGKEGVYINYSGTLTDGTKVGGRIMYVSDGQALYGLELICPLAYKEDYLKPYGQIRTTIKTN